MVVDCMSDIPLPLNAILNQLDEKELRLFACDCAMRVLPMFEQHYPADERPRTAINTALAFAKGETTLDALHCAKLDTECCAWELAADETADYDLQACSSIAITAESTCLLPVRHAADATINMVLEVLAVKTMGAEYADFLFTHQLECIEQKLVQEFDLVKLAEINYLLERASTYLEQH